MLNSKIINISLFIVVIIIVVFTYFSLQYYIPYLDDFYETMFNNYYHGKYFVSWIPSSITKLSKTFNIHYIYWLQTYGAIIKGCVIAIIMYLMASFSFFQTKKNILFPILVLFNFIMYIKNISLEDNYIAILYAPFYYYTFPLIFMLLFWKKFVSVILLKEELNNKNLIILCLYAAIIALSNDFIAISTFYSLLIILLFKKNIKEISYKKLFCIIFCLSFFYIITIFNVSFVDQAIHYGALRPFSKVFTETFLLFNEFIIEYFKIFSDKFLGFILIIFILGLLIIIEKYKRNSNYRNNSMLLYSAIFLGACFFYFTLILVGIDQNNGSLYQLYHSDLVIEMKAYMGLIICFGLGILYRRKIVLYTFLSILIIFYSFFYYKQIIYEFNLLSKIGFKQYPVVVLLGEDIEPIKQRVSKRYLTERLILFYVYKNLNPIIYSAEDLQEIFEDYLCFGVILKR